MKSQDKTPAQLHREQVQREALRMGIDEDYISVLVDTFYDRIRSHDVLGPIFSDAIGSNWELHLEKMKKFWSSVARNTGQYSGKPVPSHQKLTQVQQSDFAIWLDLFKQTLANTAPTPQAADYFMERADRIARSLKMAMFDRPGVFADC
ncbi:MAG: group III truncated hemoglobin [Anderseniella sp.]|nr:group III truncated hemoglobin [Anderseniella sp.]